MVAENVIFAWDPNPPHEQVQTYVLYERVGSDYFVITSTPGTNLVVKDVSAGHHCYALKARNAWGESLFSNEVCVDVSAGSVDGTEDLVPPTSFVLPLPPESYGSFQVSWQGQDQAGGAGVQFYDIYVAINEGPFRIWLSEVSATNAEYQGDLATSYAFYSVATDRAGNRETTPGAGDAWTWAGLANHPPEFDPIAAIQVNVGETLIVTNLAVDLDTPVQNLRFALCSDAVANAVVNPLTGVFLWKPRPLDAGTTNEICISVFDDGLPNLASTHRFEVIVNHHLDVRFEDQAVVNGETVRLPLSIFTSVPIRDLFFTVRVPPEMQGNLSFQTEPGRFCNHYFVPAGEGLWYFMFRSCEVKPFFQTEYLGDLEFTVNAEESKFVYMQPNGFTARRMDGNYLDHIAAQHVRVAIVKDTPMLEMVRPTGHGPDLVVYGTPGLDYVVEQSLTGGPSGEWETWLEVNLTNVVQSLGSIATDDLGFFRIREASTAPAGK